ncbi:hypothetical protein ACUHMQ_06650 [Chitinimonas sp. PSY-7]|uniref:hypothetical protein n=1 Tax=Chitinimonas sp. PSY-7 TaxID=3459088 RepID=UPI004040283F
MTKQHDDFDDDNDGLTDEERAILDETGDVDDDQRTLGEMMDAGLDADGDEDGDVEDEEDGSLTDEEGESVEETPVAEATVEDAEAATKEEVPKPANITPAPEPNFKPQPVQYAVPEVPDDAKQQLADIAKQQLALATQLDNYEIDGASYHAQFQALNEKALDLRLAIRDADNAKSFNAQNTQAAEQAAWAQTCDAFLTAHKATYADNKDMTALLNEAVIQVANDPENAGLNGWQTLEKAHVIARAEAKSQFERMAKLFGMDVAKPAEEAVPTKRKATKPVEFPPTIGGLPSAGSIDTGDEFAALDKLNGSVSEEAFERMSESQRERYFKGK